MKLLGRGAHGSVFLARLDATEELVAVKQVLIDGLSDRDMAGAIENEIKMISSLRHPNIVRYLGTHNCANNLNIILEYCANGSLRQMLQAEGGGLSEARVAQYTYEILCGLAYLHDNGIAHRDIKGANVLVSEDGTMKLGDFGASKRLSHESVISGLKGTPHWMAPEIIKGQQTSQGWKKADVWSLGCTVVEMLTGKMPWPMFPNPIAAMYHIANGETPPVDRDDVSQEARDFIHACCTIDPTQRPSVHDLLDHPFVRAASATKPPPLDVASLPPPSSSDLSRLGFPSPFAPLSSPHSCSTSTTIDCTDHSFNSTATKPVSPCSSLLSDCDPISESDILGTSLDDSAICLPEPAAVRRAHSLGSYALSGSTKRHHHLQPPAVVGSRPRATSGLPLQSSSGGLSAASSSSSAACGSVGSSSSFAARFAQAFHVPDDAMNPPPASHHHHGGGGSNRPSPSRSSLRRGLSSTGSSPLVPYYGSSRHSSDPPAVMLSDFDLSSSSLQGPLSPLDRTASTLVASYGEGDGPAAASSSSSSSALSLPLGPPPPLERASSQGCAAVRREALLQLETAIGGSDLSLSCCTSYSDSNALPRSPNVIGRSRSLSSGSLHGTPTRLPPLVREDSTGSTDSAASSSSKSRFIKSAPGLCGVLPKRSSSGGSRKKHGSWGGSESVGSDFLLSNGPASLVERAAYRRHLDAQQSLLLKD